ncbi:hypothetical protein [Lactococcus lactis]|uniref:hypothetical protein n=1 Tax=Lactococcus lactis TaxID=1358 RepID=UPI003D2F07FD
MGEKQFIKGIITLSINMEVVNRILKVSDISSNSRINEIIDNYSEKIYYDTDAAERWRRDVNAGNRIEAELINDVKCIALSAALLAIGGAICKGFTVSATRINKIKNAIGYICSGLGLVGSSNIFEIARTISDYYENFDNLENDWWDVQMAEHAP